MPVGMNVVHIVLVLIVTGGYQAHPAAFSGNV